MIPPTRIGRVLVVSENDFVNILQNDAEQAQIKRRPIEIHCEMGFHFKI